MKILLLILAMTFSAGLSAQKLTADEIRDYSKDSFHQSIKIFRKFLTIPNNGRIKEHRDLNVEWCQQRFEQLGFKTQVLTSDGIPHVFAEKGSGSKTILFYMQIDGQPVDTSEWFQPNPYIPVLKEKTENGWEIIPWERLKEYNPDHRIYCRSASDSKGPSMAFMTALEILNKNGISTDFKIKAIMDFQEEMGSPTLPALVKSNPELFAADMMLIMDGTRHISNLPTLTYGARGIATIQLKVFGAKKNLHSGQYGNFAPNPVFEMARLLGGMKDEAGRVTIPGYYEGITISDADQKAFEAVPENLEEIENRLGIASADKVGSSYQEALAYPSLNVRGLKAAWVGSEVRTIIPAEAVAEIDIRLVPETDGLRQVKLVEQYIRDQGFHFVDSIPTDEERQKYSKLINFEYRLGSKPFRSDMNSDLGLWLEKCLKYIYDKDYVKMRTTGGSQPIAPFITTLNIPAVSVRIPNPDNSIHAPNENIRLGNYLQGIETCLSILTQPLD